MAKNFNFGCSLMSSPIVLRQMPVYRAPQNIAARPFEKREKQALEIKLRRAARLARKLENKVRQDFNIAARDPAERSRTEMDEGELSVNFNDAAEFVEGADRAGDDDDDRKPSWKHRVEKVQRGHRPRRGKGYGYRREDE
jgi:hypothetical protein